MAHAEPPAPAFDIQSSCADFIGQQESPLDFAVPSVPDRGTDWAEAFDNSEQTGIGSVTIPLNAVSGTSDKGYLLLPYDPYSGAPIVCSVQVPCTVDVALLAAVLAWRMRSKPPASPLPRLTGR